MKKNIFIVVGMHRSGTSLITHCLSRFKKIHIGKKLIPKKADNIYGFYEDEEILKFNDKVLGFLNHDWHSFLQLNDKDINELEKNGFLSEAIKLLSKKNGNGNFCFKDPRTSILLKFWLRVFNELNFCTKIIYVFRNPLSVIKSLQKRNNFSFLFSQALWVHYNLQLIKHIPSKDILFISYDSFLMNSTSFVKKIKTKFSLAYEDKVMSDFEELVIDKDSANTISDSELSNYLSVNIVNMYKDLCKIMNLDSTSEIIQKMQKKYDRNFYFSNEFLSLCSEYKSNIFKISTDHNNSKNIIVSLTNENKNLSNENKNLSNENKNLSNENKNLSKSFDLITNSRTFRFRSRIIRCINFLNFNRYDKKN